MKLWLAVVLVFTFVIAYAGDIRTITISNAVELAMKYNLDLKQAEKDVLIAEAQYGESFADFWLPGINLSGGYTLIDPLTVSNSIINSPSGYSIYNGSLVPTGFSQTTNVFPNNWSAGVTISKALFLGFRNLNSLQIKQINLDLAKKKYDDEKEAIVYGVESSFYDLILIRENIKLEKDLDRELSNQLISSKINYNEGRSSQYDYVSVQVLYMNNQPRLIQAENAYQVAQDSLCTEIGVSDDDLSNIVFIGDLMDYTNIVFTNTNENDVFLKTVSNSITLISLDTALKALAYTRNINDANYDPSVSAFFSYQYNDKRYFQDTVQKWWPSWNLGLQLNYSVDSWIPISRTAKTDQEYDETIKKTLYSRDSYILSLRLQVKTLLLQLNQSVQNLVSQKQGLKLSQIGLSIANQQFAAGQVSSLDLINAETAYTQASANYLQAIFDYFSSTLELKRLMGE